VSLAWRFGVVVEPSHLAVTNDVEHVAGEHAAHVAEVLAQDGDLEIAVFAGLLAEEQVDRPAADDAPRHGERRQPARDLLGCPRVPRVETGAVPVGDPRLGGHTRSKRGRL